MRMAKINKNNNLVTLETLLIIIHFNKISLSAEITKSCNSISLFFFTELQMASLFLDSLSECMYTRFVATFSKSGMVREKPGVVDSLQVPPTPEYRTYTHVKSAHPECLKGYNTRSYRAILMERKFCY